MSIASTLLAHKKMFAVIAALTIVAAYMIPYGAITEVFAARGGGSGGGSGGGGQGGGGGGGSGGCEPYCHVKP
jgi:uncharacterized membrane protein YgcG